MSNLKEVKIFTDGACSGNPGPGGWGAILRYGEHEKELSGGDAQTTNNRMELTAVISALAAMRTMQRNCNHRQSVRFQQRDKGLGIRLAEEELDQGKEHTGSEHRPLAAAASAS